MTFAAIKTMTAWCLGIGLLATTGCGVYSASPGRVDENIKRVAVDYFENLTSQPNLEIDLTNAVISSIQQDNTLKVVSEEDADSILTGRVTQYDLQEAFLRQDLTVTEFKVVITVVLTFTVRSTGETLFSNKQFTGTGNYVLDDPQGTTEESARLEAAEQIVRDILAQVVEGW
ncbi:LptE family protein [bacterium]|nr:LptE family protein [bacterium]PJA75576.1 MAG: hypothetical protein CO151_05100 [bacterium CG_4_9_14_3_um_filter_65_15]